MIEFRNVSKTFSDGTEAVSDITFNVNEGELLTLIGPSGCGKTTTMKMINRLIEPTSGDIYIQDKKVKTFNVHELRWNIGYVLQEIALFPHLTVTENIAIVPEMKRWKKKDIAERTTELLNMVGLDADTYAEKMPSELSGGEQQRVGVIRALAADPDIILMDEPFSALDPISREQLQQDIRQLQTKINKTIVFVTHDIDEALALGDRVCLMKEGSIVQLDEPQQLVTNPANNFVNDFIGSRKSLWQSAVDVVANTSFDNVVKENDLNTDTKFEAGNWVVIDETGQFKYMRSDSQPIDIEALSNDLSLKKAAAIVQVSQHDFIPVTKKGHVVGTLSNRDIVKFLQTNSNDEFEVNGIG